MLIWYCMFGKPDITMACNGMLAGLVAITAPCAFVGPTSSVDHRRSRRHRGLRRRPVQRARHQDRRPVRRHFGARLLRLARRRLRWASSPTAPTARDGTASAPTTYLGQAGKGVTGLLHGDTHSSSASSRARRLCAVWAFGADFHRVQDRQRGQIHAGHAEVELEGLDVPEFGMLAYPEDAVHAGQS